MKRVKKILDISEGTIEYKEGFAIHSELCNIHHSSVHVHSNSLELVLCLRGEITINCNNETIVLKENEIFSIDYEDLHCLYSAEDNLTLIMHVDYNRLDGLQPLYLACEDNNINPSQKDCLQKVKSKVLAITYMFLTDSMDSALSEKTARELIQILEDNFNWLNLFDSYQTKNINTNIRMKKVFVYCNEHYAEKVSASWLARELHINENYFSQFFKKSPYGGFGKMLGYIRCFYAQWPLLSSEKTVTEIASECGFSDEKYFYKHFSYWWHMTPSSFRKWYKEYISEEDSIVTYTSDEILTVFQKCMADFFTRQLI